MVFLWGAGGGYGECVFGYVCHLSRIETRQALSLRVYRQVLYADVPEPNDGAVSQECDMAFVNI